MYIIQSFICIKRIYTTLLLPMLASTGKRSQKSCSSNILLEENTRENTRQNIRENTRHNTKENTRENTKGNTRGNTKEKTRESTSTNTRENIRKNTRENTRGNTRESTKTNTRENTGWKLHLYLIGSQLWFLLWETSMQIKSMSKPFKSWCQSIIGRI